MGEGEVAKISKSWFFAKTIETDEHLAKLFKKRERHTHTHTHTQRHREKTHITNIRNERRNITIDLTDIKMRLWTTLYQQIKKFRQNGQILERLKLSKLTWEWISDSYGVNLALIHWILLKIIGFDQILSKYISGPKWWKIWAGVLVFVVLVTRACPTFCK